MKVAGDVFNIESITFAIIKYYSLHSIPLTNKLGQTG